MTLTLLIIDESYTAAKTLRMREFVAVPFAGS